MYKGLIYVIDTSTATRNLENLSEFLNTGKKI